MDLFAEEARTYADTSGAIAEYDSLGYVSEYHLDTIQSIYNKHIDMLDRAPLAIYKTESTGGASMFLSSGWAAYLFGTWNNEVSRHYHLALYGIVHVYDKAFFRGRFPVFLGGWGWTFVHYTKPFGFEGINNQATSILAF